MRDALQSDTKEMSGGDMDLILHCATRGNWNVSTHYQGVVVETDGTELVRLG